MQPWIKGWSCMRSLFLRLSRPGNASGATAWPTERLPYVLGEWLTCQGFCPSDCVISYLLRNSGRTGGGRRSTLIPLRAFFLLPKPERAIHSRMDHMLTFPFVCMRQCCCRLYHFSRRMPALLNKGGRKSVGLPQQQRSSEKYTHCSNRYLLAG